MDIYVIYSADEYMTTHRRTQCAFLSYIARHNTLLSEKLPEDARGGMMIVASNDIGEHIAPVIYDECRKRRYSAVFLDADEDAADVGNALGEVSASLSRRGLTVFCPISFADFCESAIPVAEAAVSGGELEEHISLLTRRNRQLALSIPRICAKIKMPMTDNSTTAISRREAEALADRYDASPHFSPQLVTNYFLYSPAPHECSYVLFDDSRSISQKLRLAKHLGVSSVFLTYREIADIAREIAF